jgi:hypothetical protein
MKRSKYIWSNRSKLRLKFHDSEHRNCINNLVQKYWQPSPSAGINHYQSNIAVMVYPRWINSLEPNIAWRAIGQGKNKQSTMCLNISDSKTSFSNVRFQCFSCSYHLTWHHAVDLKEDSRVMNKSAVLLPTYCIFVTEIESINTPMNREITTVLINGWPDF